ncbi:hypothetical protein CI102_11223 [Trichoderma harzianum]|nr:hypothetical protein CI102_11223 [Trichoderma harzianum]
MYFQGMRIIAVLSRSCYTLFWGNATSFVGPTFARQLASSCEVRRRPTTRAAQPLLLPRLRFRIKAETPSSSQTEKHDSNRTEMVRSRFFHPLSVEFIREPDLLTIGAMLALVSEWHPEGIERGNHLHCQGRTQLLHNSIWRRLAANVTSNPPSGDISFIHRMFRPSISDSKPRSLDTHLGRTEDL